MKRRRGEVGGGKGESKGGKTKMSEYLLEMFARKIKALGIPVTHS